jgi:hypothetical protein
MTNVAFTSLSGAGNYSFYYDKGSIQDANLVANIYSGQVSEYHGTPASTDLLATSSLPSNNAGTITLSFTTPDPYFRAYKAVFYSGATPLYTTPYFYPDYDDAGVVSPYYPPSPSTTTASIPILIVSAILGNENIATSVSNAYLTYLIDSRVPSNFSYVDVIGSSDGGTTSSNVTKAGPPALFGQTTVTIPFSISARYPNYYIRMNYWPTNIGKLPATLYLTSNTFTINSTYPVNFGLTYTSAAAPTQIIVYKSPDSSYSSLTAVTPTSPSSSSGNYTGVLTYDSYNVYYVCKLTVNGYDYYSQKFTMLPQQTSRFDIAQISIPPAPAGTVNTITRTYVNSDSDTFTFDANSNQYNRIVSSATFNSGTNFTMDYSADTTSTSETSFGWKLTSLADANIYIYGYATMRVNPTNDAQRIFKYYVGDTSNGSVISYGTTYPTIYTLEYPKIRVILEGPNNNLFTVAFVLPDNSIETIGYVFNSIGLGNFKTSFGPIYDNAVSVPWSLLNPTITVV